MQLLNDGQMLVNDGEMSEWSYTQFTIIDEHFTIINDHWLEVNHHSLIWPSLKSCTDCISLVWKRSSFAASKKSIHIACKFQISRCRHNPLISTVCSPPSLYERREKWPMSLIFLIQFEHIFGIKYLFE